MLPENLSNTDILLYTIYGLGSLFIIWCLFILINVFKQSPETEAAVREEKLRKAEEAKQKKLSAKKTADDLKKIKKTQKYATITSKPVKKKKNEEEEIFTISEIPEEAKTFSNPFQTNTPEDSNPVILPPTTVKPVETVSTPNLAKNTELVETELQPKLIHPEPVKPENTEVPPNKFNLPF